jgi:hypothetical protein
MAALLWRFSYPVPSRAIIINQPSLVGNLFLYVRRAATEGGHYLTTTSGVYAEQQKTFTAVGAALCGGLPSTEG